MALSSLAMPGPVWLLEGREGGNTPVGHLERPAEKIVGNASLEVGGEVCG